MKIPKKFKLFGTTINVLFDDIRMHKESSLGMAEINKSLISLTTEYEGEKLQPDTIMDTYYHEKVHIILDSMREYELSLNEKFVEVFSKLLRQSDATSEF